MEKITEVTGWTTVVIMVVYWVLFITRDLDLSSKKFHTVTGVFGILGAISLLILAILSPNLLLIVVVNMIFCLIGTVLAFRCALRKNKTES